MPKQALPGAKAFGKFRIAMEKRGFRELSRSEFRRDFERLGLEAPFSRDGREIGFVFHANGLDAVVWTSFLSPHTARESDSGWVLIREGDEARQFSHPLHRTEKFLSRLLGYASVARLRVLNRPNCPNCGARMHIAEGKALKSRYWRCDRHSPPAWLSFDHGLPKEAIEFLEGFRKERARYRKKARAEGKKPGTALLSRKGWTVTKPENIVRS